METKIILVVDDDKFILKTFKDILELRGYRVQTAESGKEALEKFKNNTCNLALLDIKLPDMEGTELLAEMHKIKPHIMKIMVTGYASLDNAILSLNSGADAYIMKPVMPEKLIAVIEDKLREQEEVEKLSEEKLTKWLEDLLLGADDEQSLNLE
jgi:two-component system nitrogen regulation response regulator NtrX